MSGFRTETPAVAVDAGQVSVTAAGSAHRFPQSGPGWFRILAHVGNAGGVYIAESSAAATTSNGAQFPAGVYMDMKLNDLNLLYVDASTSGDTVSWFRLATEA